MHQCFFKVVSFLGLMLLIGCNTSSQAPTTSPTIAVNPTETPFLQATVLVAAATETTPVDSELLEDESGPAVFTVSRTYHQADGNRVVIGQGNLPDLEPLDIPLLGAPAWITAVPFEDGALWAVALEDGRTQAFLVEGTTVTETPIAPGQLPPDMPLLLVVQNGKAEFIVPDADFSPLTHPVFINEKGDLAYVDVDGNLIVRQNEVSTTLPVGALPDARILVDENERLLLLTGPTTAYTHGVLGDDLEASNITLVETNPASRVVTTIPVPAPHVIEGIAPIWTDLDGDGLREIIVTRSSPDDGAQIVVFGEDGTLLAAGPAIGRGFRWRHQLAAAPFGPNGELELADVLTPHIGGTVEFYRWEEDALSIVAGTGGYTSHVIGTRNLDMAVAGDFDGSGHSMLLLPNQARTELGGILRTEDGAIVAWALPVDGTVVTNVVATTLADGRLAAGAGREDGVLRIWQP